MRRINESINTSVSHTLYLPVFYRALEVSIVCPFMSFKVVLRDNVYYDIRLPNYLYYNKAQIHIIRLEEHKPGFLNTLACGVKCLIVIPFRPLGLRESKHGVLRGFNNLFHIFKGIRGVITTVNGAFLTSINYTFRRARG
jgi:hypothetical protein